MNTESLKVAQSMKLLSISQVSDILGVSQQTVRRYIRDNTKGFRDQCVRQFEDKGRVYIIEREFKQWILGRE